MHITPALLNTTVDEFFSQYKKLMEYYDYFQIDIADGNFVPNTTISISDLTSIISKNPSVFKGSSFDFHLMVSDYSKHIEQLDTLGDFITIKNIFIHFSALQGNQPPSQKNIGIVLNPEDMVTRVSEILTLTAIPAIQIMTIIPGFQGNAFKPDQLTKIKELRELGYKGQIFIDGGVNAETLPVIMAQEYPPDFAGIGSYLAKAPVTELAQRVEIIRKILESK